MDPNRTEQRIRLLEEALLWYVVRYGPRPAALAACKEPTVDPLAKQVHAKSKTPHSDDHCHRKNAGSQNQEMDLRRGLCLVDCGAIATPCMSATQINRPGWGIREKR